MKIDKKLIVVLGPTACGKTKMAVKLAAKYGGEIVSADSRQVYCGMDIGTGKDLVDYQIGRKKIPYYLIDVVKPMTEFNVGKYQKLAYAAIDNILSLGKRPFLVGGTGLYLDAVTQGYQFLPNKGKIRNSKFEIRNWRSILEKWSIEKLLKNLKTIDPQTYGVIDRCNRRRVQRALEIYFSTGQLKSEQLKSPPPYEILIIGIKFPLEKIYQRIDSRLEARIKEGMIKEIKKLRRNGVTWKRLEGFGLEYRWVARYLQKKINYDELLSGLKNDIHHFAKRQLTWFKRNPDIHWVENFKQADKLVKKFLH